MNRKQIKARESDEIGKTYCKDLVLDAQWKPNNATALTMKCHNANHEYTKSRSWLAKNDRDNPAFIACPKCRRNAEMAEQRRQNEQVASEKEGNIQDIEDGLEYFRPTARIDNVPGMFEAGTEQSNLKILEVIGTRCNTGKYMVKCLSCLAYSTKTHRQVKRRQQKGISSCEHCKTRGVPISSKPIEPILDASSMSLIQTDPRLQQWYAR